MLDEIHSVLDFLDEMSAAQVKEAQVLDWVLMHIADILDSDKVHSYKDRPTLERVLRSAYQSLDRRCTCNQ